ncbi:LPO_1073/Vpar_1526 family protein [Streptomyces sp. NPDC059999]|uniref:LPO_1073/Vpar_1526 family protein n=1 Tax=Streptomyces sp. NPDC059999 TaxID=3347030 RepID=UPI003693B251
MWQRQRGGDSSALLQAKNINIGVGVEDVEYISRRMAIEVLSAHSREAFQLMSERVDDFARAYLDQLLADHPEAIQNIRDPGVQAAILDAESAYARSGDDDLGSLLVDILTKRTTSPKRNLTQLALSESINVAQKLTSEQYSSLSLVFLLRNVRFGINSLDGLHARLVDTFSPVFADAAVTGADAQHLIATGCAILLPVNRTLPGLMADNYPGLFAAGIDHDNPVITQVPGGFLRPSLRDPTKLQVDSVDRDSLRTKMTEEGIPPETQEILNNLLTHHTMNEDALREELIDIAPSMRPVTQKWDDSLFSQLSLTSVGIVLAHSNISRLTAGSFSTPLEIFLSPE